MNVILAILELLLLLFLSKLCGHFVELSSERKKVLNCYLGPFLKLNDQIYRIPPLLGMLLAGMLLVNIPGGLVDLIPLSWSSFLRKMALIIILLRAGLGLNWEALKVVGWGSLLLAFCPLCVEALVDGILSHYW